MLATVSKDLIPNNLVREGEARAAVRSPAWGSVSTSHRPAAVPASGSDPAQGPSTDFIPSTRFRHAVYRTSCGNHVARKAERVPQHRFRVAAEPGAGPTSEDLNTIHLHGISETPTSTTARWASQAHQAAASGLGYSTGAQASAPAQQDVSSEGQVGNQVESWESELHQHATEANDRVKELITTNMKLVYWLAHKMRRTGLPLEDLIGEGSVALQQAASRFDPGRGVAFGSYAYTAIKRRMQRASQQHSRPFRVPEEMLLLMRKEQDATRELQARLQRAPTLEEVSDILQIPLTQLQNLRRIHAAGRAPSPLNRLSQPSDLLDGLGAEGGVDMSELVAEDQQLDGDASMLAVAATVSELLEFLPPQQRLAVELRYGLADRRERRLGEVAEALQMSKREAKALLVRALSTLRVLAA